MNLEPEIIGKIHTTDLLQIQSDTKSHELAQEIERRLIYEDDCHEITNGIHRLFSNVHLHDVIETAGRRESHFPKETIDKANFEMKYRGAIPKVQRKVQEYLKKNPLVDIGIGMNEINLPFN